MTTKRYWCKEEKWGEQDVRSTCCYPSRVSSPYLDIQGTHSSTCGETLLGDKRFKDILEQANPNPVFGGWTL